MPGSDKSINYQIRPAKSVERKMICSLIREIQMLGGLKDFRYIGMGAKYFADFVLFHNQFGTKNLISIEADISEQKRYEFNKPLSYINMKFGLTTDILPQIEQWDKQNNLVWLDYDGPFKESVLDDIETVARNCISGDVLIITVNASCAGADRSKKKDTFKKQMGKYFDDSLPLDLFTNKKIPKLESKMIIDNLNKFIKRKNRLNETELYNIQLLDLVYKDSAPMLTVGVAFWDKKMSELSFDDLKSKLPFVSKFDERYNLKVPKLTNKEIQLILRQIPISQENFDEEAFHGISLEEITSFERIYRYYPYFNESGYNN